MRLGDEAGKVAAAVGEARAMREGARERLAHGRAQLGAARKTRKSAATRERIMASAIDLMAERGGTDFQMSEVAARCQLSKGSLYYYFADRDALVQAVFAEIVDDTVVAMEDVVDHADSARDALRGLCAEFVRRVRSGSPLALALTSELSVSHGDVLGVASSHLARATSLVAAQLERAKAEGFVRGDVDASLAAGYLVGGFLMTSVTAAAASEPVDDGDLLDELMGLTLAGIGAGGASAHA